MDKHVRVLVQGGVSQFASRKLAFLAQNVPFIPFLLMDPR